MSFIRTGELLIYSNTLFACPCTVYNYYISTRKQSQSKKCADHDRVASIHRSWQLKQIKISRNDMKQMLVHTWGGTLYPTLKWNQTITPQSPPLESISPSETEGNWWLSSISHRVAHSIRSKWFSIFVQFRSIHPYTCPFRIVTKLYWEKVSLFYEKKNECHCFSVTGELATRFVSLLDV